MTLNNKFTNIFLSYAHLRQLISHPISNIGFRCKYVTSFVSHKCTSFSKEHWLFFYLVIILWRIVFPELCKHELLIFCYVNAQSSPLLALYSTYTLACLSNACIKSVYRCMHMQIYINIQVNNLLVSNFKMNEITRIRSMLY